MSVPLEDNVTVVALAAPAGCGKTMYLAALQHLAMRAAHRVGNGLYKVRGVSGYGPRARDADDQLARARNSVLAKQPPERTDWYHAYRVDLELLDAQLHEPKRATVIMVDAQGGKLFPGLDAGADAYLPSPVDRPPLTAVLRELDLADTPSTLLTFVNEPFVDGSGWRMHSHVPATLADYLHSQPIHRLAYYVACADTLFPRVGDLGAMLEEFNRCAEDDQAWAFYKTHFKGSPHLSFAIELLEYLYHARHLQNGWESDGGGFAMFWGSSLGVQDQGRANVDFGLSSGTLRDTSSWSPLHVLEPILWAAGLYPRPGA